MTKFSFARDIMTKLKVYKYLVCICNIYIRVCNSNDIYSWQYFDKQRDLLSNPLFLKRKCNAVDGREGGINVFGVQQQLIAGRNEESRARAGSD